MNNKILLKLFTLCFITNLFAQDPIEITSACGPFYGQGIYRYQGVNDGKSYYMQDILGFSGGNCATLPNQLDCERDALYFIKWETDRWYWIREPFQCQWDSSGGDFEICGYGIPSNSTPIAYMYSNTANTPEPPASGWTVLPTCPPNYCEPSLATLSTISFLDAKFKIYPNPVKSEGIITIDLGESFKDVKISLYSISGRLLVKNVYEMASQIKIKMDQPKGIYLLKIKADNDVVLKKIILE